MIIAESKKDVAVSSSFKTTGFSIQANSKAFEILSSNIYQNKIRAVIREISCNAHDAHVAANNPNPFKVHLPTIIEPHFSVRDFGTGLTDCDIREIFTTYFCSTKTTSNDFIGALGLGSKSPFCLVDSFIVNSWKDGVKNSYSCYKDAYGEPQIALLFSENSDEPNGLEVLLNVEKHLIHNFFEEAIFVFESFSSIPDINIKEVKTTIDSKIYDKVAPNEYKLKYERYGALYAVMGNVAYEINIDYINNTAKDYNYSQFFSRISGYINFDIGEISFNPGRENLSYDVKTIDAIHSKLKLIEDKISNEIKYEIEKESNKLKRLFLLSKHDLPLFNSTFEEIKNLSSVTPFSVYSKSFNRVYVHNTWTPKERYLFYRYKNGYDKRIKNYVKNNDVKIAVVNDIQIAELDIPDDLLHDLETLPKIVRNKSYGQSNKVDVNVYKIDLNSRWGFRISDDAVDVSTLPAQKIYVEITGSNKNITNNPEWCDTSNKIHNIVKYLETLGVKLDVIYAVRSTAIKRSKFKKDASWIKFDQFVFQHLDGHIVESYNLNAEDSLHLDALNILFNETKDERLKFVTKYNLKLNKFSNTIPFVKTVVVDTIPELQDTMLKYPMLSVFNQYTIDEHIGRCTQYMNHMDQLQ